MPRSLAVSAVLVLCVLASLLGTAAAASNVPPLADAGLDQTVSADATVHLNANGSRDPDGALASVRWTVEAPSGTTTAPDCPTCRQTQFQPEETGRYNVTLAVTDDDGATRSDTLFVDVRSAAGPSVTLSGPSTVVWNRSATLRADVERGDASLSTVAWVVDGHVSQRDALAGETTTIDFSRPYTSNGSVSVRAVVYDTAGRRATASHDITVLTRGDGAGSGGNGPGDDDCHFWSNSCLSDAVLTNTETGERSVINANGEQGIQVMTDAYGKVDAREYVDVSKYRTTTGANGPVHYDADMIDAVDNKATLDKTEKKSENKQGDGGGEDDSGDNGGGGNSGSDSGGDGYTDSGAQDGYNTNGAGNAGSPSTGGSSSPWTGDSGTSFGGFSGGSYF